MKFKDQNIKKIGIVALEELATQIIKLIPILGPYIEVGMAIRSKVQEYREKQDFVRKSELTAIGDLSRKDAEKTIDSLLTNPGIAAITKELTIEQLQNVKRQLVSIPSEIDQILKDVWAMEKQKEINERDQKKRDNQRRKENNYAWYEKQVKELLVKGNYSTALSHMQNMIRQKPFNTNLWKSRYTIYKLLLIKEKRKMPEYLIWFGIGGFLLLSICAIAAAIIWVATKRGFNHPLPYLLVMGSYLLNIVAIFFFRKRLLIFYWVTAVITVILFCAGCWLFFYYPWH